MEQRPNYITPAGYAALRGEYDRLFATERPALVETIAWAAGNGDRSENGDYIYGKRRLREIDRRIRFLQRRLDIAEVVDPAQQKAIFDAVDHAGELARYAIIEASTMRHVEPNAIS